MPDFLRTLAAGAYLKGKYGVGAPKTLAKLRVVGGGPEFQYFGRIPVYTVRNLDRWAKDKLGPQQRSTSDVPARPVIPDAASDLVAAAAPPCRAEDDVEAHAD
jgi:hypothetical protein